MNLHIDPVTRDYTMDSRGELTTDETALTPIVLTLMGYRGLWWADLNLGSRIRALMSGSPPADPASAVRAAAEEALRDLVDAGSLTAFEVSVESDPGVPGRVVVRVDAVDARGRAVEVELPVVL